MLNWIRYADRSRQEGIYISITSVCIAGKKFLRVGDSVDTRYRSQSAYTGLQHYVGRRESAYYSRAHRSIPGARFPRNVRVIDVGEVPSTRGGSRKSYLPARAHWPLILPARARAVLPEIETSTPRATAAIVAARFPRAEEVKSDDSPVIGNGKGEQTSDPPTTCFPDSSDSRASYRAHFRRIPHARVTSIGPSALYAAGRLRVSTSENRASRPAVQRVTTAAELF